MTWKTIHFRIYKSTSLLKPMKQIVVFILVGIIPFCGFSQIQLNQKDAAGKKQGQWIKLDSIGKKVYEGQFKNNIPQGTFKYYFPSGSMKAVSVFSEDGKSTTTTTYFPSGKKNAEGKYVNEKKDGLWRFFSEYDESLVSEEMYSSGKKNGPSKTFFAGKNTAEMVTWVDGKREGPWIQYFDDGSIKLQGTYKNDMKEGSFIVNYPTGQKFNTGQYLNDLPDGKWFTYDLDGKLVSTDIYSHGELVKSDKAPEPAKTEIHVKLD
jgi:antitoxin component YwqK of YwqJK toxin-antitoxin module